MASLETIEALLQEFKTENAKEHGEIIVRLDKTNGSVLKNTAFRLRISGGMTVIGAIGVVNLIGLVALFIKSIV